MEVKQNREKKSVDSKRKFPFLVERIIKYAILALIISFNTSLSGPINQNKIEDSETWEIELPRAEMRAPKNLSVKFYLYALKKGYHVVVYKRNLSISSQMKIFEYDEGEEADNSGNYWRGLPPNMALSPDKTQLAYIDKQGLKIYELLYKRHKSLITKINIPANQEEIPEWSNKKLKDVYNLHIPRWSFDNQYISFVQSYWEGSSCGIIEIKTGKYFSPPGTGNDLKWSPTGAYYFDPSHYYGGDIALWISEPENIKKQRDLLEKFDKNIYVFEANFSPDGKKLVLLYYKDYSSKNHTLSIIDTDGTNKKILHRTGIKLQSFFTPEGDEIIYIGKRNNKTLLTSYHLKTESSQELAILPSEFNRFEFVSWLKERYLVLVGISHHYTARKKIREEIYNKINRKRLFILDLKNRNVIYASPIFSYFTTFNLHCS